MPQLSFDLSCLSPFSFRLSMQGTAMQAVHSLACNGKSYALSPASESQSCTPATL